MNRPIYETQNTLDAEKSLVEYLEVVWSCSFKKLSRKAQLDYAAFRHDKLVALVELKCRTVRSDTYPTYMLSLDKIFAAHRLKQIAGVPVFLIVQWIDVIGYMQIGSPDTVGLGGRIDRDDPQDIELVGYYNIEQHFTNIEG